MQLNKYTSSGTVVGGTPLVVSIPMYGASRWSMVIKNTGGTNAITSTDVAKLPLEGGLPGTDTALQTAIGSIAHDASVLVEQSNVSYATLRLTLHATTTTTYQIDFLGTGSQDS